MKVSIWKDGRVVATALSMRRATLPDSPVGSLQLFFFPTITLAPPVVFEHLAGRALSWFLDRCGLEVEVGDELYEPLRYVHGRTETMKGRHKVSSVLLAKVDGQVDEVKWLATLPSIYSKFLALAD